MPEQTNGRYVVRRNDSIRLYTEELGQLLEIDAKESFAPNFGLEEEPIGQGYLRDDEGRVVRMQFGFAPHIPPSELFLELVMPLIDPGRGECGVEGGRPVICTYKKRFQRMTYDFLITE